MLFSPNSHPLNWYPFDVRGSIELLSVYINDIEAQVEKNIGDFRANANKVVVDHGIEDEPGRIVTYHKGLDDESWQLESVFGEYFPGLQRRSAVITLYSFFENEMDNLCYRVRSYENLKLDVLDLNDKGIIRSTTYLLKVAEIEGLRASAEWSEIANIQAVRNLLVHADGKFGRQSVSKVSKVAEYVARSSYLSGEISIKIERGYLAHCLSTFDMYFEQVHAALRKKYAAKQ
jgi:hypothetical protein